MLPPQIQWILFDIDNTLWSRNQSAQRVLRRWFDTHETNKSTTFEAILKEEANGYSDRIDFFEWLSHVLNIPSSGEELWNQFKKELCQEIVPNLRQKELLERLQTQFRLGIVSKGNKTTQYEKIDLLGYKDIFLPQHCFFTSESCFEKNEAEFYQEVFQKLKASPQQVCVVGDHWQEDICNPLYLGTFSVWIAQPNPSQNSIHKKMQNIECFESLDAFFVSVLSERKEVLR